MESGAADGGGRTTGLGRAVRAGSILPDWISLAVGTHGAAVAVYGKVGGRPSFARMHKAEPYATTSFSKARYPQATTTRNIVSTSLSPKFNSTQPSTMVARTAAIPPWRRNLGRLGPGGQVFRPRQKSTRI